MNRVEQAGKGNAPRSAAGVMEQIAGRVGCSKSTVSRVLSGQQGVPIGKIDALVNAAGFVLISRKYLEAIGTLGEVGMYCHCARAGGGECGPSRQETPTTSQELRGGRA